MLRGSTRVHMAEPAAPGARGGAWCGLSMSSGRRIYNDGMDTMPPDRDLAAFHLDKLVEAGLLEASFRRLGERRGPGAGRPAKLYRRGAGEVAASLPPRT